MLTVVGTRWQKIPAETWKAQHSPRVSFLVQSKIWSIEVLYHVSMKLQLVFFCMCCGIERTQHVVFIMLRIVDYIFSSSSDQCVQLVRISRAFSGRIVEAHCLYCNLWFRSHKWICESVFNEKWRLIDLIVLDSLDSHVRVSWDIRPAYKVCDVMINHWGTWGSGTPPCALPQLFFTPFLFNNFTFKIN